jgi:hypothetical protein
MRFCGPSRLRTGAPETLQTSGEAIDLMTAYLASRGMPTAPEAITRADVTIPTVETTPDQAVGRIVEE